MSSLELGVDIEYAIFCICDDWNKGELNSFFQEISLFLQFLI
jgi:hypothetical protein